MTTTATNLTHGFGLKSYLQDTFDNIKAISIIILKLPARKAITNHIVSCPEIFAKVTCPKTTKRRFIENGMIDKKIHMYPYIVKLLQTCKSEIKQGAEDLIFTHFSELYTIMKIDGHIKEEVYDHLRFKSDSNYAGDTIDKTDGITQEMRHRAKILGNALQYQLRQQKEDDALAVVETKEMNKPVISHDLYTCNDIETTKLLQGLPEGN